MLRSLSLLALLLIAACATPAPPAAKPRVAAVPLPPPPGLARLYGRDAAAVLALLGPASMDRSEGLARQLQFVRPACVLDVYLYPVGGTLAVNGAAARKPDGSRIEPGVCLGLIAR
jgi:hypothetical protein